MGTITTSTTAIPAQTTKTSEASQKFQFQIINSTPYQTNIQVYSVAPELTIVELIEKTSREYGVGSRSALAVAKCESHLRHYNEAGEVLRGEVNRYDVGVFQINEYFHLEKSRELGFDIYTPTGNIEYAIWLMKAYGRAPWVWSRQCWDDGE